MKTTEDKLGRTLSGQAQTAERLAALAARRNLSRLCRFMENAAGPCPRS